MTTTMSQNGNLAPAGLKRTVAPTLRIISVSAFKLHHNVPDDDTDTLIEEYIEAATDFAEQYQRRCFRDSTWQALYDCFPSGGVFYVPIPPLIADSVSITYLDEAGASQTLASSVYTVDAISQPGRVALAYGQSWPSTYGQIGAVTLQFDAGYETVAAVPARTKQAIRKLVSHWVENKEPMIVGTVVAKVPLSVTDLLDQDRFVSYR